MSATVLADARIRSGRSAGLWTLAWQRFCRDRVGVISLLIVAAYFLVTIASALHLMANDWAEERGVNYAPPSFTGADVAEEPAAGAASPAPAHLVPRANTQIVDPLADVLAEIHRDSTIAAPLPPKAQTLPFGGD